MKVLKVYRGYEIRCVGGPRFATIPYWEAVNATTFVPLARGNSVAQVERAIDSYLDHHATSGLWLES